MTDHTIYQLARLAEVANPDAPDSPGAVWLRHVAGDVDELRERVADGTDRDDAVWEAADSLVPVYTHERWQVFVDLAAYTVDTDELVGPGADMTTQAGIALFEVARTLLNALLDELDDTESKDA